MSCIINVKICTIKVYGIGVHLPKMVYIHAGEMI